MIKNKISISSLVYTSIGACCVSIGVLFFQNSFSKYILLGVGIILCAIAVITANNNKKV
jgi:multidrug transporter EmrE-like cation transporter